MQKSDFHLTTFYVSNEHKIIFKIIDINGYGLLCMFIYQSILNQILFQFSPTCKYFSSKMFVDKETHIKLSICQFNLYG